MTTFSSMFRLCTILVIISLGPIVKCAVLLVSFDGFRWRYLHDHVSETSWFHILMKNGTASAVGSMRATFTTKTFPSHITLVTGLYQESHGIVGNVMHDPVTGRNFTFRNRDDQADSSWWSDAVPIWITAEQQGKKSGTFFWPGSEVEYEGKMQSYWKQFNKSISYEERVDTVVEWISEKGVQFATVYFGEPDSTGHSYGPNSEEIPKTLMKCNNILGYLIHKLKAANVLSSTNIIIVSDHGMSECEKSKIHPLYKDIEKRTDLFKSVIKKRGQNVEFVAQPGRTDDLYNFLKNVIKTRKYEATVYKKSTLPDRFHYRNNIRISDVLIFAKEGYTVAAVRDELKYNKTRKIFGCHGFDNALINMEPIFIAHGPDIASGKVIPTIRQVDVYNLLAKLLKIKPRPNNGTLKNIEGILKSDASRVYEPLQLFRAIPVLIAIMKQWN